MYRDRFLPLCYSSYIWTLCTLDNGSGANWPTENGNLPGAGRDFFLPICHWSYIWTLCTLDPERGSIWPTRIWSLPGTLRFLQVRHSTYILTDYKLKIESFGNGPTLTGRLPLTSRYRFLIVCHSSYIWMLCTQDTEIRVNWLTRTGTLPRRFRDRFLPVLHSSYVRTLCTLDDVRAANWPTGTATLPGTSGDLFLPASHSLFKGTFCTMDTESVAKCLQKPRLYQKQVEIASLHYVIYHTYRNYAHWTLRTAQKCPENPGITWKLSRLLPSSATFILHINPLHTR
jgi:hypothetical protein